MKCPFCQGVIDDDSRYCDLCGKHLMFCPECRQPKKGTSCPRCGELLISAEEFLRSIIKVTLRDRRLRQSLCHHHLANQNQPRCQSQRVGLDILSLSHWKKLISTRYSMPC